MNVPQYVTEVSRISHNHGLRTECIASAHSNAGALTKSWKALNGELGGSVLRQCVVLGECCLPGGAGLAGWWRTCER